MSKVYFVEAKDGIIKNLEVLLEKAGVSNLTGVTAVKMHMGERNQKEKRLIFFTCKTLHAIAKEIRKLFIYSPLFKSQAVKNEWEVSVRGGYMRTKFEYTTKLGGYANKFGYTALEHNQHVSYQRGNIK
jgi:uncharacterized Fe-S center protein